MIFGCTFSLQKGHSPIGFFIFFLFFQRHRWGWNIFTATAWTIIRCTAATPTIPLIATCVALRSVNKVRHWPTPSPAKITVYLKSLKTQASSSYYFHKKYKIHIYINILFKLYYVEYFLVDKIMITRIIMSGFRALWAIQPMLGVGLHFTSCRQDGQ